MTMITPRFLPTVLLAALPAHALAADIRAIIHETGNHRSIVIEGPIIQGDYERFLQVVRENQARVGTVYLFTPGGDFDEAMKIGRAMRALELDSMVPMRDEHGRPFVNSAFGPQPVDPKNATCASAGFFIHIGALHRGGTYLAVHRPFFAKDAFARLSEQEAKAAFDALQARAKAYMTEMDVPTQVQEQVLATPSDKILVLEERTVRQFFWGTLPHRHEWLRAKCSLLTEAEEARLSSLSGKLRANRELRSDALTKAEWDDLRDLRAKENKQRDEQIKIIQASRAAAYEKFFGAPPSDSSTHNFSKWHNSFRFIGQRFADLQAEEKFVPSKFGGTNFLDRPATATSPSLILSDSADDPMRVSEVLVLSPGNPSEHFRNALVASLTAEWGPPSASDDPNEWRWITKGMIAKLQLHPVSASGPYLALSLRKR